MSISSHRIISGRRSLVFTKAYKRCRSRMQHIFDRLISEPDLLRAAEEKCIEWAMEITDRKKWWRATGDRLVARRLEMEAQS